ncbi:hypothetical protein VNO80_09154 [Phaseolus coccineus]|uniref:Uncharacterized protein n=1 Tax=Phaseolus coccineus TaxID=3886 RepID=A0AAN9R989_PHACN
MLYWNLSLLLMNIISLKLHSTFSLLFAPPLPLLHSHRYYSPLLLHAFYCRALLSFPPFVSSSVICKYYTKEA